MSAIRRLSAVYRREQRQIRACPYHRSEKSELKEKKSSRVGQPSFFSSYLPLIPSQWSSYLGYFNIFNIFGSSKDSRKKDEEDANVVVVPEEDAIMTDSEATTTTTEESSSDSSVEIIEVLEAVEPVAPVEPTDPSEPAAASLLSVPTGSSSLNDSTPFLPSPQSSIQNATAGVSVSAPPSSATFLGSTDDEIVQWAWQKSQSQTPMNDAELLGLKAFLKQRQREQPFSPIKLRYSRYASSSKSSPGNNSGSDAASSQRPDTKLASIPSSSDANSRAPADDSSYWSAFHSSTGLPTFKNNTQPSRPRMLKQAPIVPRTGIFFEESRKRPAVSALPRLDPYKRRRLFEKPNNSDLSRSHTSSNAAETVPSIPPRVSRSNINQQHAEPHAPSALRNVGNGVSLSSPRQMSTMPTNLNASGSKGTRSTYSTTLVQEIVGKAPPRPRYSDVANPYQTAAPVKPLTRPMERKKMSERRARTRELEKQREAERVKESEKKKELSAKEIIEATIPKGAKRSRPPPGLAKSKPLSTSTPVITSKRSIEEPGEQESKTKKRRTVTVEEVSDDDGAGNRSVPVRPNVIIECRSPSPEPASCVVRPSPPPVEVPVKVSPAKSVSGTEMTVKEQGTNAARVKDSIPKVTSVKEVHLKVPSTKEPPLKVPATKESSVKTSAIKAPSAKGLGNHFAPLLNAKATGKSSVPREPSKLRTSFLPDDYENEEPKVASPTPATTVVMTTPGTPLADIQEKKDPKEVALTLPLNDLPSFIFKTPPSLTAGDHVDARVAAKELPVNSLPKFDFSKARSSVNGMLLPAVPIPTIKPFDFCAAGIKPSASRTDGQWQCPTCMLQNASTAVEKCTVCDSPRPDIDKPKKTTANDVSGTHGVNDAGGKDTLSKLPMNSSAAKAFNFAAAGLKPNAPSTDGQWTCSTCMLQNPPTAVEKCEVCDSVRPAAGKVERPKKLYFNGTTHSPSSLTNGASAPTTKSFDFAAAGVKPPASSSNGNWQCPTCMLQNPGTATEKCKICDSPHPELEKRPVSQTAAPAKSSTPIISKSFDWAAAGMVPKMNGNSWTCASCMLSNPPTATEKCRVCDASRS